MNRPCPLRTCPLRPYLVAAASALLLAACFAPPISAQYMYLDTNGDQVNDSTDVILATGTTTVDVFVVTNANRAGEPASCEIDPSLPMTIYSYNVVLKAVGGTVQWQSFVNQTGFTTRFGSASSSTELVAGWGSYFPWLPGRYLLGSVKVTVANGTPSLIISPTTTLPVGDPTSFGSSCYGQDFDNTLKLGLDWFDADGAAYHSNALPLLSQPSDMTLDEGTTANQSVSATDPDGDPIQLTKASGPSYMTFSTDGSVGETATGTIHLAPNFSDAGVATGVVSASDGFGAATASFTIEVNGATSRPDLSDLYDLHVAAGESAVETVAAYDTDGDAAQVTFEIVSGPPYASLTSLAGADGHNARAEIHLSPGPGDLGTASLTVAAVKGVLRDQATIEITVVSGPVANVPPLISPLPDVLILPGGLRTLQLSAGDPDGQPVSARKLVGPRYVTMTAQGYPGYVDGLIDIRPQAADLGAAQVVIGASDGWVETLEPFTVNVVPTPEPVFTEIQDMVLTAGVHSEQIIHADDPDDNSLIFSMVGPPYLTIRMIPSFPHESYGVIRADPGPGDVGDSFAIVRVSDGVHETSHTMLVTVLRANRAPTASAGGPYAGTVGQPIAFDGTGSVDPDGDTLSFSWDFGDGTEAMGAQPVHAYAAPATYSVLLTVTDGLLPVSVGTVATITGELEARAFTVGARSVPLTGTARAYLAVYLEPVGGNYRSEELDTATLVMRSDSTGTVDEIHIDTSKATPTQDRDGNGVQELTLRFGRNDIAALFAYAQGRSQVEVSIEGALLSGARVRATLTFAVVSGGGQIASVYPNPLNPSATLGVVTIAAGPLEARLFDVTGRLVRVLARESWTPAGYRAIAIDGKDEKGSSLASGVYFYRVVSAKGTMTGQFTIAR